MDAIDLRGYFPDSNIVTLNKSGGTVSTRYTFKKSPSGMDALYYGYLNINKPGLPYMWRKEYLTAGTWCTPTYAVLFMGDDKSITEVGDWYASTPCTPNVVFGYKTATGVPAGLLWSGAGGLSDTAAIAEVDIWRQNTPGAAYLNSGSKAYSKTGLIELLSQYTPPFGRDEFGVWCEGGSKTYQDVAHIVMYHGTKTPGVQPVRCIGPISANGAHYQSYKDYSSYAIELWIAKGVGIIQENTPFIEDATFWNIPNCTGNIFSNPGSWITYIDQQ